MAYIPEKHKKYDLLPWSRDRKDWDCFAYPVDLLNDLEKDTKYNLMPYGFADLNAYIQYAEEHKAKQTDAGIIARFDELIKEMRIRNNKEEWSVLKYIGEDYGDFTHNRDYYWPCSFQYPEFEGAIDDEEFTSYLCSVSPKSWIILEDPTGMAAKVFREYEKGIHPWFGEMNEDEEKEDVSVKL